MGTVPPMGVPGWLAMGLSGWGPDGPWPDMGPGEMGPGPPMSPMIPPIGGPMLPGLGPCIMCTGSRPFGPILKGPSGPM